MDRQKNIIFDTDMGPDCDDAGALAILHKMCDFGEARALAMGSCIVPPEGACCIDAINYYYGRKDIPVGTLKTEGCGRDDKSYLKYNKFITENFDHSFKNKLIPDVLDVYIDALTKAADDSVIIVTTGMFTNIANLMRLPEKGSYFPGGLELMRKKVKRIVSMAGSFMTQNKEPVAEFNVVSDIPSCQYVVENWDGPLIFCPYETGYPIFTGNRLISAGNSKRNPVAKAYQLYCTERNCRSSWDLVAVYYSVRGTHDMFRESKRGIFSVDGNGITTFKDIPDGKHFFIANKVPSAEISQVFEDILNLSPELVR